jgi:hypothetical protein
MNSCCYIYQKDWWESFLDHDWLFRTQHHHNDSQKSFITLLNLLCYSFDITNGAPDWAKKNLLSPSGSLSFSWFFKAFIFSFQPSKRNSSKPRKVSSSLRSSVCSFIRSLPYCVLPSINDVSSTPAHLCVTSSALSSLPFFEMFFCFFSNPSFQKWFSKSLLVTCFRLLILSSLVTSFWCSEFWWMITVKIWWTLAGVFVEGFSFPNKQDWQMACTDRSSSFLPVVNTILASFTPASMNCEFEASGR